jgi:hypothetical protein
MKTFLSVIIAQIFGNPFLPHARETGSLTILGGTGFQRGVEAQEVGINCESFECRYFPEVNEGLAGIGGEIFVKAKSVKPSRDVTIQGEVSGATGVMAYTTTTACTTANDTDTFGGTPSGDLLLDEATETQNRTAWRSVNIKLSSNPNLTVGG